MEDAAIRIFIVDDDLLFSKALESYLINEVPGVEITCFPNGEACLHEMQKNPDLILLDYMLDSEFAYAWDGLQILKKINDVVPGIAVVILSSKDSAETAMEFVQHGALEYVVKNEKTFSKIKSITEELKSDIGEEDMEEEKGMSMPKVIGLMILIMLAVFLVLKL